MDPEPDSFPSLLGESILCQTKEPITARICCPTCLDGILELSVGFALEIQHETMLLT